VRVQRARSTDAPGIVPGLRRAYAARRAEQARRPTPCFSRYLGIGTRVHAVAYITVERRRAAPFASMQQRRSLRSSCCTLARCS
jgi:hypothetical protein